MKTCLALPNEYYKLIYQRTPNTESKEFFFFMKNVQRLIELKLHVKSFFKYPSRDARQLSNGEEDFRKTSLTTKLTTQTPGLNI